MSSKRKLVITNNSCLKLIDRVKRQRGKCGHSSNPTPPKIDFTVLNAPLSVVFQFIDTKALVSRVSHCNKQFHSVSKNANAWRYSKCLVNIQSRGPFECPLEHLPMLRRLNLFNRDYIPPANLCFLANDLEFVPQLNALELISFYFHSPDNLANSYYTGFNILIQNLKVLP